MQCYRSVKSLTKNFLPMPYVCVGDVKLSELKAALAEKGISSDFLGGQLVCSGAVTVKRGADDGGLLLEGPLSQEYYNVRSVLYSQYHLV